MKRIALLGSTGSIGRNTLEVAHRLGERVDVAALGANSSWPELLEQAERFGVDTIALAETRACDEAAAEIRKRSLAIEVKCGARGLAEIASAPGIDLVVSAIVGSAGLMPTLKAVEAGKTVALANKEPLVMAGELVLGAAKESGAVILPVDSEHSAVFQCLKAGRHEEVAKLILTASGGPFFGRTRKEMADASLADVLNHPTWDMGRKITIDSATLMNKALEIIEAKWLFGVPEDRIEVVIHPQSIIHSMVEFVDGVTMAQMGLPDMQVPIQYALTYPARVESAVKAADLRKEGPLEIFEPDTEAFPTLGFAYQALKAGGTAPAVLNAANEKAVGLFIEGKIGFLEIFDRIESALARHRPVASPGLEEIVAADRWAREEVAC